VQHAALVKSGKRVSQIFAWLIGMEATKRQAVEKELPLKRTSGLRNDFDRPIRYGGVRKVVPA
jgi:hypothetical protein